MSLVYVFSGTSEGRELCEKLSNNGVSCRIFVATEYGDAVMDKNENMHICVGRLEKDEIASLIKRDNPDYVIDATHPYAKVITENIIEGCEMADASDKYIRVIRTMCEDESDSQIIAETGIKVSSTLEALNELKHFPDEKIMLTTGVKELSIFAESSYKDRLIVRILPGIESLEKAYAEGISTKQIIAMEGPFSEEMNIALIEEYNAGVLITKNSGSRGGFIEKIRACKACGIKAIIIENDSTEIGISIDEAVNKVCGETEKPIKKQITLAGVGICKKELLVPIAFKAIKNADVLIGAMRMIAFGKSINDKAECFVEYDKGKVRDIINNTNAENIVVLLSGDTGLCSGAKGITEALKNDCEDSNITIIPGISSVSYFASRLGIQYSDYQFVSLHGNDNDYMKYVNTGNGFIAICSGACDVINISKHILDDSVYAKEFTIYSGKNLGSDDEEIMKIDDIHILDYITEGLYVIAVIRI